MDIRLVYLLCSVGYRLSDVILERARALGSTAASREASAQTVSERKWQVMLAARSMRVGARAHRAGARNPPRLLHPGRSVLGGWELSGKTRGECTHPEVGRPGHRRTASEYDQHNICVLASLQVCPSAAGKHRRRHAALPVPCSPSRAPADALSSDAPTKELAP